MRTEKIEDKRNQINWKKRVMAVDRIYRREETSGNTLRRKREKTQCRRRENKRKSFKKKQSKEIS
jgi:hypothetical protein